MRLRGRDSNPGEVRMAFMFQNDTGPIERHLTATSTTVQFEWFTDWRPSTGVDNVRAVMKATKASPNFIWQLAYQTAAVRPDNPDAPGVLGTAQTGAGETSTGSVSFSPTTTAWFRLGIGYSRTAAGTVEQADVMLRPTWTSVGTLLGSRTLDLEANDTGNRVAVVTSWFPTQFVTKVKAALVGNSVTGGSQLQYKLVVQTAPTSIENPGAWLLTFEAAWRSLSAYTEVNTGDLSLPAGPPPVTDAWTRVGVVYALASGTVQTAAQLDVVVFGRL